MQVKQKQWKKGSKSSYLSQLSRHKTWELCATGALGRYKTENSDFEALFTSLSDWDELTLQAMLTLTYKPNKKEEPLYRKWIKTFPALTPNPVQACTDFLRWMLYLKPWKSRSKASSELNELRIQCISTEILQDMTLSTDIYQIKGKKNSVLVQLNHYKTPEQLQCTWGSSTRPWSPLF